MIYPWQSQTLTQALAAPPHHALLIHGPAGLGAEALARAYAQARLCETDRPMALPGCGTCPACRWFNQGQHPDYRELTPQEAVSETGEATPVKASTTIRIDAVRDLLPFVTITTHRQGWRVILIDPVDALNEEAANALLKTLEEPTPKTQFLLISPRPGLLPATIRSRCRSWPVGRPDAGAALHWLAQEGVNEPALYLALGDGAPLQAIQLAEEDQDGKRVGLIGALGAGEPLHRLAGRAAEVPLARWLGWLQRWAFDLLEYPITGRARYHLDLLALTRARAPHLDRFRLLEWERQLREARRSERHPLNPRLVAESLLLTGQSLLQSR